MKHPILFSLMSLALSAALPAMAQSAAPAGATGQCKDGSYTSASFKMGACRGHKGVQSWFGEKAAAGAAASTPASGKSGTSKAKTASTAPMSTPAATTAPAAGATGLCKDGTSTNAASKSGACRGHNGVQEWYAGTTAGKPAPVATPVAAPVAAPARPTPARPAPVVAAPASATSPVPAARAPRAMPAPGPVAAGGGNGQVWVNLKTKVYHCQGDRWYGTSKDGQYMSENAAVAAGARASRGKTCGTK